LQLSPALAGIDCRANDLSAAANQPVEPMTDEQHRATLQELDRNYLRSVDEADVAWFDANLAPDFFNTNPDGTLVDLKLFSHRSAADHR
jgi:hypothetical protein